MPKMTAMLTDRLLASLKPREERYVYWEPNRHGVGSLGIRVSPQGTKTFVYMYWQGGTAKMMTVGRYPTLTLAEAHKAASDAMLARERGSDPARAQVEENQRTKAAKTVADLADEFMEKYSKLRKKSWKEDERILNHDILPVLGKRHLEDVRRRDIVHLLDGIVGRGAPVAANRALAVVRKMFNFAVARDLLEHSPCTQVQAPVREQQRDRVLTTEELKMFFSRLSDLPLWTPTQLAMLAVLVTGQRCGEVVAALWSEIDLDAAVWTIPSTKAKNKLSHRVPLSPTALQLLKIAKQLDLGTGAVFPSRTTGNAMVETAIARAVARNLNVLEIEAFTPHDLRRTAASHMTSIGVPRLVVSKILNHVESGITAVYDRHGYDVEKREALDRWSVHLQTLGVDDVLARLAETAKWQVEGKWWDKRKERLELGGVEGDEAST